MQRQLWASQRRNPESPHQNTALLSTIDGVVEPERLSSAFARVVAASDVLRTRIDGDSIIVSSEPVQTELLQMGRSETSRWAAERSRTPLEMRSGGIDSVLIQHPDRTTSWYLNLHHVITDATASSAIFAATAATYHGASLTIPAYYKWANQLASAPLDARSKRAQAHWENRTAMARVGRLYEAADGATSSSVRQDISLQPLEREALNRRLESDYASLSSDLAWTSLLVTASALYLHRVSGANEMAIGLPVHNRSTPESEAVFGPVMQVFPVDVSIETDDTHRSLHKRIAKSVMTTVRNARPGVTPNLSDVEAVVNVIPRGSIQSFGPFSVTTEWVHPGATDPSHLFQLQLTSYADGEPGLSVDVNSAAAGAQRDRVGDHFRNVICGLVKDPDSPIGDSAIITQAELETVRAWGDRRSEILTTKLLPEALETSLATATLTHNKIQLVGPELLAAVRRTAWWLQNDVGIEPGDRVAVQMDRSADAVLAILGLWWSGASYVPIDPCQPELRRASLIERAGCVATLTEPGADCLVGPGSEVEKRTEVGADSEAYLLFTSGSTGEPKGVPITHRGVADYLHFARTHYLDADDHPVVPLFSALTFDLTVTSLFLPLLTGGELVVIESDGAAGLKQIAEIPRITWAKATPSHLELFLRLAPMDHDLRTLVIGGEALGARLTSDLWAWQPELRMFNEYGPTEAVVGCMIYEAMPTDGYTEVPIGQPAPGVELRIVDVHNRDVPLGSPGELLISSRGVTKGYLGTGNGSGPFVQLDGQRFYRSGDLVRFTAPGVVTYLGRADEQIKVGGIRLDPTEVEFALEQHPLIRRAAVRLSGDVLAAWFETTGDPDPLELRTWLADRVPSHAIPVAYVPMTELPTTNNGKLDARSLSQPTDAHRVGTDSDDGEISLMEQRILTLWSAQLRLDSIGVNAEFFDLGGDSLAGMQSVFLLGESLGLDLPEELIFANRSARQLAAAIEGGDFEPSIRVAAWGDQLPSLSPGEQAMVFAWLNDPDSTANNVGRSYRIAGSLDPSRLEAAARALVERHLPLRLTYVEPRRLVPLDEALEFVLADPTNAETAERTADAFFAKTFDPEVGARVRILLTPLTAGETSVVITMHHALIDEAGLDRLFEDLAQLYEARDLPPLPDGYERFASTQIARSTSQADRNYWMSQPAGSALVFAGASEADGYVELPASFSADHLDRHEGISAAAVSLSAAASVLADKAAGGRIEIGMPLSVRSSQDHDLAGYALNVLPLVVDLADPLNSAAAALTGALTHRNYPFASIVSDRRSADMTAPPLNALLAFGNLGDARIGGFTADHRVLAPDMATAEVTFFVQVRGESVNLAIEYSGSSMTAVEAANLLADFEAQLAGSGAVVSGASAVPTEWLSEPLAASVPQILLDELVAQHATNSPDAIAVSHEDIQLTYSDLIGQANAIAHQVVDAGIKAGSFVGVLADRSASVIPAILGILRAGCAYVPIDPEYPIDRIETIVQDSGISVVLIPAGLVAPALAVETVECRTETASAPPLSDRSLTNIAYAIFTSGSTGRPKGVQVDHANIVYSTAVRDHVYPHSPRAFLLLSSFAFDSSMVGLWWTLCTGGEVVLPDSGLHTDVDHMGELISSRRVSHLLAIPSLYQVLLGEVGPEPLTSLNTVMVAGEACPPNLVTSHYAQLPAAGLHNEYGPTETTVWSHHHLFSNEYSHTQPVPIGRPIPGATQLVLDEKGEPVMNGQSGELFVGGPGVTVGYVGQPELTNERFVVVDGDRYYRTGDLVRWLEQGDLEFLGRVDHQVKVRGVRIELGEVESAVLTDSAVQSAAAGTVEAPAGTRLAVWIVVQPGAHVSEQDVKARLAERLPTAMVPSLVFELASMPLTPNGKVDRGALVAPEHRSVVSATAEAATGTNPIQTAMLTVWTEVLGAPSISLTDNFFDLGGDSILSIRIVSGLRRHGIRIKPRDLFDHPSIGELELIAQVQTEENTPTVGRFTGPALLLPMQEWFFQQGFDDPNHWNQSMWFDLNETVDLDHLEKAFTTVIDHHDSLRAVFTETELGWIQRIVETVPMVRVQEFNNLPVEAIPAVTASIEAGMDIEGGKLVGAALFRSSEGDRLFVTIHHLVIDGVSWRPIIEDLTSAYRDRALPPRTSPVATFGAALTELQPDPHWDLLAAKLPPPSQVRRLESEGQQITVSVDGSRTDGLFERMLSSIAKAHQDVFGADRLTATLEGHGRADELRDGLDLSRTVGWFTAMYPISLDPAQPVVLDAPRGGVGALDQVPTMPRLVINYLGQIDRSIAGTDLLSPTSGIEAGYGSRNHRTHDLGIMAHVSGGQLQVTWDFVAKDHPTAVVRQAADAFLRHFTTTPSFDLVQLSESDLAALDEIFS